VALSTHPQIFAACALPPSLPLSPAAPSSGRKVSCGAACVLLTRRATDPGCRVCASYTRSTSVTNRLACRVGRRWGGEGSRRQCGVQALSVHGSSALLSSAAWLDWAGVGAEGGAEGRRGGRAGRRTGRPGGGGGWGGGERSRRQTGCQLSMWTHGTDVISCLAQQVGIGVEGGEACTPQPDRINSQLPQHQEGAPPTSSLWLGCSCGRS
jgi:hypothetical protein